MISNFDIILITILAIELICIYHLFKLTNILGEHLTKTNENLIQLYKYHTDLSMQISVTWAPQFNELFHHVEDLQNTLYKPMEKH